MIQRIYPVITLYQPWATWIIRGWKTIETRLHDRFKGLEGKRILIHAGKTTDNSDTVIYNKYLTAEQLAYHAFKSEEIINGFIIGECFVQGFKALDESHSKYALIDCGGIKRYGLFLNEIMMLDDPIKVKGEMGIWYFDTELMQKVKASEYKKLYNDTNRTY